jgi:alkylhydroperoxidase family enzyme
MGAHGAVASVLLGDELTNAVLADWRTADVPPKLRAGLALVERIARSPDELTVADLDAARAAGVSNPAIRDLAYVVALFATIVRVADSLDWAIPDDWSEGAKMLVRYGYRLPPLM